MSQKKGRRLVFFPLPFQGHISPMIQLANILHSRGFDITIIHTQINAPNPSNCPHFTFHSIPDGTSNTNVSTASIVAFLTRLNADCIEPFRHCLASLLSEASKEPIACLITDALWYFTQAVSDSLKLPRIVLRTTSICSFVAYAAIPLLEEKGYLPKQDSRLEELVPELSPLKIKDIPRVPVSFVSNTMEATKVSSGIIWNTSHELEQQELGRLGEYFPIPSFLLGPFHMLFSASSTSLLTQDRTSISWLNTQAPKSVVYVSFGSIATMDKAKFAEMAWGLADSKLPFLWVVRPGIIQGSEWLEALPEVFQEAVGGRGHIVKWAPQQEVLAHPATGCFWSHCGWNSTLESMCEGVPMICSPFFGDQPVHTRYVNDLWRCGVALEKGIERGEIVRAINRIMVEKEGEEMRHRIMSLKENMYLGLKEGGSSYQSLEGLINYMLSF